MAYSGMSPRNRSSAPVQAPRTVVTRVRRNGQQVAVSPPVRSPFSNPRVMQARLDAAYIPPNPMAGVNPSTAGFLFGSRRPPTITPGKATTLIFPPNYALGDEDDDYGQMAGFSLKGIAKAVKKVASPIQKVAAGAGHLVGNVVTSKVGQGILGTALAVTGVGAPAAAGIFAATKGVGNLIKPGGNIKHAVTGAAQGAVEGVVAVGAGRAVRAVASKIANRGAGAAASKIAPPSTAMDAILNRGIPGVQVTPYNPGPTTADIQAQVASEGAQASAIAAAQQAQAAAEAARADAARQAAESRAALDAARQQANDAAAAQHAAELAQLNAQLDAATKAAQAAQTAAQNTQAQAPSVDTSQLDALVKAAQDAARVAQQAAAAPPTPQATAAVQQGAQQVTDQANDAAAGAPADASVLGSLTSNPILLVALVGAAVILTSGKRKRGR